MKLSPDSSQPRFRFWLWLIRFVGLIVPRRFRTDWRQEWEAELRHREELLAEWDKLTTKTKLDLLWRSTSAFWDALWLQPRRWEDEMVQDLRLGIRMLITHPGFTIIAVLTLALGIGANITIFSVVNAALLRPLPYPDADRLVFLWSEASAQNIHERASAYSNVADWGEQNQSFEDFAVFDPTAVTLTGAAEPEQVMSIRASASLFSVLGVAPMLGRTFTTDEVQQRLRVVILSHGLWQRRFGASPKILGQTLEIDGMSSQVIGVMPKSILPDGENRIWEPQTLFPDWETQKAQRGTGSWQVIGRLKANVSLAQAQTEMNTIAQRLEQAYPDTNKGLGINLVPLELQYTGSNVRLALWMLFGAVVLVLLIACTNVANLMLARGIARQREMAIRIALGAGRLRLIRQLLTESGLLVLLAGAVGLFAAHWGIQAVLSFSPANLPRLDGVAIDARVLVFTIIVSLLTGLLFGLAPALKVSQTQPVTALKAGRSTNGSTLRGLLVITEFGLAVLLLAGAGLLLRSFSKLQAVDPGFDPARVLSMQLTPARNGTAEQWRAFYQQVSERVAALPGVETIGLASEIFINGNPDGLITIEGGPPEAAATARIPFRRDVIGESLFQTLRVPLRKGRFFNAQDNQGTAPVTIINETMAHRFWPGEEALGKRFKLGPAQSTNPWLTVVGVVGDTRRQSLERQSIAQLFLPYMQNLQRRLILLIRTTGEPTQLAPVVRNEVGAIDKTVLVNGIASLESLLDQRVAERRFQTWLLTLFSALALLLSAVGIYGLMHQSVALCTREIGTRMALGAEPRDVLRLVIGQGMRLALCGVGIGLLAAFGLTRVLAGLLFGVTATDPATFLATPLVLLLVAALACYLPARRATRVDPILALRHE
ncbi:MAG: ABC transporter permease [Acidobacteria bacterium]|nr:ABC transporter permease [Acidobacteriota bacterium]